jgi:Holliday junction resolvase RusA-like endonuclease
MEAGAPLTVLGESAPISSPAWAAGHTGVCPTCRCDLTTRVLPEPTGAVLVVDGFEVAGHPVGQGSKTVETRTRPDGTTHTWVREDAKGLEAWRAEVTRACRDYWQDRPPLEEPMMASALFGYRRPGSHFSRSQSRWGQLLPSAPQEAATTGADVEKLVRAICDSMQVAGMIRNDKLICRLRDVYRRYDAHEYVRIWLWELPR